MSSEAIVRRYYKRLFLLPKAYVIIATYLIVALLVGIASATPAVELSIYLNNVINYVVGFTVFLTLNLITTKSKTLNIKRVLGLTTILICVFSIAEVILTKLTDIRGLGVLATSGMAYIVLQVFMRRLQALITSTIPQFITYLILNSDVISSSAPIYLIRASLIQVLSLITSVLVIIIIESKGRSSFGIKPMSLINAFVASWFSNDPQPIELEFDKYSESSDVLMRFALIKTDSNENILLVFPTIHFGPFRNIGSSRFIYDLERSLGSRYQAFVFHTPCSHERNLTTSLDSGEIVKYLNNNLDGLLNTTAALKPCKPYVVVGDSGWEAYVVPLKTGFMAFLKNLEIGSDDLPYEIWDLVKGSRELYFYSLIDTHSAKGFREVDLGVLKNLLDNIVNNHSCDEVTNFSVGYGEGYVSSLHRGLCFNKVKSLVMDFNGSKHVLIYLYGNNMDIAFRKALTSEILSLGVDYVEVVTPDDHSCAASFKESPYDVVNCCDDIIEVVKGVVSNAMSNTANAYIHTADVVFRNVRLIGNKVWDMVGSLEVLGSLAAKYILISLIIMNAIPLLTLISIF